MERNKDAFVAGIFNSELKIGKLAIAVEHEFDVTIEGRKKESGTSFYCTEGSFGMTFHGQKMLDDCENVARIRMSSRLQNQLFIS